MAINERSMLAPGCRPSNGPKSLIHNDFSLMPLSRETRTHQSSYQLGGSERSIDPHSIPLHSQRRWASYRVAENSPQSPGGSPQSAAELQTSLAALLPLAMPARTKKKLPAAQMREVILSLCEGCWLAAGEIALLVARDAEKLQSRLLTAMVREGLLELKHPDVPNRPDQAYRSLGTKT